MLTINYILKYTLYNVSSQHKPTYTWSETCLECQYLMITMNVSAEFAINNGTSTQEALHMRSAQVHGLHGTTPFLAICMSMVVILK